MLEPTELLRRLAALCPSPGTHLVRYHGVFANRSKLRSRLPPPPPSQHVAPVARLRRRQSESESGSGGRQRSSWAQLLARVFFVNVLLCPRCGGRRRILAFLVDPVVVRRILSHLKLPSEPPALSSSVVIEMGEWIELRRETRCVDDVAAPTAVDRSDPNERGPP